MATVVIHERVAGDLVQRASSFAPLSSRCDSRVAFGEDLLQHVLAVRVCLHAGPHEADEELATLAKPVGPPARF